MNEIPVGTPPAPPGRHAAPSGWYPDPVDLTRERYWDGWQWSREVREAKRPRGEADPSRPTRRPTRKKRGIGPSAATRPTPPAPAGRPRPPAGPARPAPARPTSARPPVPTQEPVVGVTTADGVRLAGFWWRFLAAMLDQAMLGVVAFLLALPFLGPAFDGVMVFWRETVEATRTGATPPLAPTFGELLPFVNQLGLVLVNAAVQLTYHILFWRFRGATLGQLALGLRVVPVDEGRSTARLGYGVVVPRAVLWGIPWCLSSLYFIGVINGLWSMWNPRRMAVHDLVAKTQVIRTRP